MIQLGGHFFTKIFAAFAIFISVISLAFTSFFIQQQSRTHTDNLITEGILLSRILAFNSRLGIFFENKEQIKDQIVGVIRQEGVMNVYVYDLEGRIAQSMRRPKEGAQSAGTAPPRADESRDQNAVFRLRAMKKTFYLETSDTFEFWASVISGPVHYADASLFFDEYPVKQEQRVIGFVLIEFNRTLLETQITALLIKGVLIAVTFLAMGFVATFFMVTGITRPLNRLIDGVTSLGKRGYADEVPVQTSDEIGQLADAFNTMSASLMKREESLRMSEQRSRFLSSRLLEVQEQERRRISRELHDELGQGLVVMKHRLRSIERGLTPEQADMLVVCEETQEYLNLIIEDVRRLSRDLSPNILTDLGLTAALRWLLNGFSEAEDAEALVDIQNVDRVFNEDEQTNLYRISQEILTNISRHAHARHVVFMVENDNGKIRFEVREDGVGFDPEEVRAKKASDKGMGLEAMHERANMLKGTLNINSRKGEGTVTTLTIHRKPGGPVNEDLSHYAGR